jgi:hypothetical protein
LRGFADDQLAEIIADESLGGDGADNELLPVGFASGSIQIFLRFLTGVGEGGNRSSCVR